MNESYLHFSEAERKILGLLSVSSDVSEEEESDGFRGPENRVSEHPIKTNLDHSAVSGNDVEKFSYPNEELLERRFGLLLDSTTLHNRRNISLNMTEPNFLSSYDKSVMHSSQQVHPVSTTNSLCDDNTSRISSQDASMEIDMERMGLYVEYPERRNTLTFCTDSLDYSSVSRSNQFQRRSLLFPFVDDLENKDMSNNDGPETKFNGRKPRHIEQNNFSNSHSNFPESAQKRRKVSMRTSEMPLTALDLIPNRIDSIQYVSPYEADNSDYSDAMKANSCHETQMNANISSRTTCAKTFFTAMRSSAASQVRIHAWDKKMGLRRSHSKTMRNSMKSRNKLQNFLSEQMLSCSPSIWG